MYIDMTVCAVNCVVARTLLIEPMYMMNTRMIRIVHRSDTFQNDHAHTVESAKTTSRPPKRSPPRKYLAAARRGSVALSQKNCATTLPLYTRFSQRIGASFF